MGRQVSGICLDNEVLVLKRNKLSSPAKPCRNAVLLSEGRLLGKSTYYNFKYMTFWKSQTSDVSGKTSVLQELVGRRFE